MELFFPKMANDAITKEHYSLLKKRTLLVLQKIQGINVSNDIQVIEDALFDFFKPKKYDGSDGVEISQIKGFNDTCVIINQYVPKDPKTMTVVEFYQTLDIIKDQLKERKKASKIKRG